MTRLMKVTLTVCACALICGAAFVVVAPAHGQAATTGPFATKATVEITDAGGKIPLKREEQIAFMFVDAIKHVEAECGRDAGGPCTIEVLAAGPKSTDSIKVGKLKFNPITTDPNYTYKLTINGSNWELWATPKRAGLGGFYVAAGMMGDTYYSAKGAASNKDRKLTGTSINGDIFFQD
jgi:hypothetical protein